ncbi:MAG: DUF6020 family protein [bacterium]|nr:DUF6020 family protein [bacterium]
MRENNGAIITMRRLYKEKRILYCCYVTLLTSLVSLSLGLALGEVKLNKSQHATGIYAWILKIGRSFSFDATNDLFLLLLIGIVLFFLVRRQYSRRCKAYSLLFSLGGSILLLLGRAFYKENNLSKLFSSAFALQKAFMVLVGYSILLYWLLNALMEYVLPKLAASTALQAYKLKKIKLTIWSCFAFIVVAWLPYVVIMYPCNFTADSRDEVAQFLGDVEICKTDNTINYPEGATTLLNNHHPVTYTILVGTFAKEGKMTGSINGAMFLFALLQMTAMAFLFSYTILYIKSLDVPVLFQLIGLGFFMFYPLFPIYALTVTKDSLYGGCILLLTIQLLKMMTKEDSFFSSNKELWILFGSALGLQLLRNNGLYVMLVLFIVLLIRYRKNRNKCKKIVMSIGIPVILYGGLFLKVILPMCNIPGGSPREMLSVPFQQVARYAVEWGEEGFQNAEIETLDKILCFEGDLEVLKERYDPVLSDPVKSKFNKDYTKEELKEFMVVWAKLLKRHPGTFVTATLNNIYYYFSVDYGKPIVYVGAGSNGEVYGIKNPDITESARTFVLRALSMLNRSSMLGGLFSVGTWSYLFLFVLLYCGYKRRYEYLIMALPVVLNIMIAIAGPVAYMRYAIQWIMVVPVFGTVLWLLVNEVRTEKS